MTAFKKLWKRLCDLDVALSLMINIPLLIGNIFAAKANKIDPQGLFQSPVAGNIVLGILWYLIFHSYLIYLYRYYDNNRKQIHEPFFLFIYRDLIFSSIMPFRSILFVLLVLTPLSIDTTFGTVILIIFGLGFFVSLVYEISPYNSIGYENRLNEHIVNQWDSIKKRIEDYLSEDGWVDIDKIEDIARIWRVDKHDLANIFIKYANENPDLAFLGRITDSSLGPYQRTLISRDAAKKGKFRFTYGWY